MHVLVFAETVPGVLLEPQRHVGANNTCTRNRLRLSVPGMIFPTPSPSGPGCCLLPRQTSALPGALSSTGGAPAHQESIPLPEPMTLARAPTVGRAGFPALSTCW